MAGAQELSQSAERPEHLVFPGLDENTTARLVTRLDLMAESAKVFAAGLTETDVGVEYTLGSGRRSYWMRGRDGSLSIRLFVDLLSPLNLPPEADPEAPQVTDYCAAFRAGFLHALGRVMFSPCVDRPAPLASVLADPRPRLLDGEARRMLAEPAGRRLAEGILERLEGDRTDGLLRMRFPHAVRHQRGRDAETQRRLQAGPAVDILLAEAGAVLRGREEWSELETTEPLLYKGLKGVSVLDGPAGAYRLAEVVLEHVLPCLLRWDVSVHDLREPAAADEGTVDLTGPDAYPLLCRPGEVDVSGVHEPVGGEVVRLPHVLGGEALVRVDVAEAGELEPTRLTRDVISRLTDDYGPRAREAFVEEEVALRRALRVNWERRHQGRYRSGKRVGIPNLRRYVTLDDPRVFQRLQTPDALSYYFHLLVDASYSMLKGDNLSQALAVASAFTETLQKARIPVDVTLYSSAITRLHDHRRHIYDAYFGADFGFLVSGTMEMEAIAYAKTRADAVPANHKLLVVLTDGTPVNHTLPHVGAETLDGYYHSTLIPWLQRVSIDLLAIGIGVTPAYHRNVVCLDDVWESLPVFLNLLEEVVHEGESRTTELWR